jgi:hypothetical protein
MNSLSGVLSGVNWVTLAVWVPTAAVVLMVVLACLGAALLPERAAVRRGALLVAALFGAAAIAATVWTERRQTQEVADRGTTTQQEDATRTTRRLHAAWEAFDAATKELPPGADPEPTVSFDTQDAGFAALSTQADALAARIKAFRAGMQPRRIDDQTASAMVDYLKPLAHGRVVVSCIPEDDEAYLYANRVATILRRAGWDASGPEFTAIFGTAPAIGIGLYARSGEPPDTAKVLTDAFTKFSIPYQSGIAASDAIPDTDTVELFVGKKP